MRLGPISTELVTSLQRVNSYYRELPASIRPSLAESWNELEANLHRLAATGDQEQASAAIERWEAHALRAIGVEP